MNVIGAMELNFRIVLYLRRNPLQNHFFKENNSVGWVISASFGFVYLTCQKLNSIQILTYDKQNREPIALEVIDLTQGIYTCKNTNYKKF